MTDYSQTSDRAMSPMEIPTSLVDRLNMELDRTQDFLERLEVNLAAVLKADENDQAHPVEAGVHAIDQSRVRLAQLNGKLLNIIERIYL